MIDLRAGTDVFQIKTGKTIPEIIIESSNNIAANGVVFQRNGDLAVINLDGEKFTIKVQKYEESLARKHKNKPRQKINGYVIAIPDNKYDLSPETHHKNLWKRCGKIWRQINGFNQESNQK